MNFELDPEVEQYIAEKVATGEFTSPEEVINDAIRSKLIDEETGLDRETLIAELKKGIASLEAGRCTTTTPDKVLETLRSFRRK